MLMRLAPAQHVSACCPRRASLCAPSVLPRRARTRSPQRAAAAQAAATPPAPAAAAAAAAVLARTAAAVVVSSAVVLAAGVWPVQAAAASAGVQQQSRQQATIEGPARVVDGDTLVIGTERIRLYGVDAPETKQLCSDARSQPYACGVRSAQVLKERVGQRPVRCRVRNTDQYGRSVAACDILPGQPLEQPEDIGRFLVSRGLAVAYRSITKDYVPLEEQAHRDHRGIWQGAFQEPAAWRRAQKAGEAAGATAAVAGRGGAPAPAQAARPPSTSSVGAGAGGKPSYAAMAGGSAAKAGGGAPAQPPPPPPLRTPPPPPPPPRTPPASAQQQPVALPAAAAGGSGGGCAGGAPLIKGNISAKGRRIYHTPASGQYQRVIIDEAAGERYFCSEAEALAAGWAPAAK